MADSSNVALYIAPEASFGVPPTGATFKRLRITGESLNPEYKTAVSNEITSGRVDKDTLETGFGVAGDVQFELSADSFDSILEAVVCSSLADAGTETVGETVYAKQSMTNGSTKRSFTILRVWQDLPGNNIDVMTGCVFGDFSFDVGAGAIITGSAKVMGAKFSTAAAAPNGGTLDVLPGETDVLTGAANVGDMTIDGAGATMPIKTISVAITNNLREKEKVGTFGAFGYGYGRFQLTGKLEAYFEDRQLYDRYLARAPFAFVFDLVSPEGTIYRFDTQRDKIEKLSANASGNDQDVMVSTDYRATLGSGTYVLKVSKLVPQP